MLIKVNYGSALSPITEFKEDSTKVSELIDVSKTNQINLNGRILKPEELSMTLKELNVQDNAHIVYSSKQESGKESR